MKKVDDRLIAAISRFSFKLYNQLLKQRTTKNVFVSPSSVILALAMTYNGAEGETRQAMVRALELEGLSLEEVNRGFADLESMLGSADPKLQLNIANSLWARQGFALKPDFIQRTKEFYAAEVTSLDFSNPTAPATINSWVKNNTGGRIEKIVDDKISDDTILFLINAIYFKGQWTTEFEKSKTKEDNFTLADGSQKKLPMMSQSGRYTYYKRKDFQAVSLPYGSGRMSMYVFLPDKSSSLDQFERNLTVANWETWMKSFRMAPGEVILPRFKIEYEVDLNDVLKALGMAEAFDSTRANFSGIAQVGQERIFISRVKHKTFAEVNEEGTVAAAVTSVGIQVTSALPPQENFIMKVDRPFFVAIRDNVTGTVLFMGSIANPSGM